MYIFEHSAHDVDKVERIKARLPAEHAIVLRFTWDGFGHHELLTYSDVIHVPFTAPTAFSVSASYSPPHEDPSADRQRQAKEDAEEKNEGAVEGGTADDGVSSSTDSGRRGGEERGVLRLVWRDAENKVSACVKARGKDEEEVSEVVGRSTKGDRFVLTQVSLSCTS